VSPELTGSFGFFRSVAHGKLALFNARAGKTGVAPLGARSLHCSCRYASTSVGVYVSRVPFLWGMLFWRGQPSCFAQSVERRTRVLRSSVLVVDSHWPGGVGRLARLGLLRGRLAMHGNRRVLEKVGHLARMAAMV